MKEVKVKASKKEKVAFLILILIQIIIQLLYWIKKWEENYIPDKDINEKILTENPVPSNLQEVPVMDELVKTLLVACLL